MKQQSLSRLQSKKSIIFCFSYSQIKFPKLPKSFKVHHIKLLNYYTTSYKVKIKLTLFNQSPATSSGVVAWLELAELDLRALGGPPGGVLELPPEGVEASDLEVLDEGWSEP